MKGNHLPIFALVIDYAMQLSMRRRVDLDSGGSRLASSVEREALPHTVQVHTAQLQDTYRYLLLPAFLLEGNRCT